MFYSSKASHQNLCVGIFSCVEGDGIGACDVGGVVDDCWWDTSAGAADFCCNAV